MIILLVLFAVLLFIGTLLLKKDDLSIIGIILSLLSGILLLITPIIWATTYYGYMSEIKQYESIKQTIEYSRNGEISDVERAALINKIIDINSQIADAKYWNHTIFDQAIPDEYANLEPLK